MTLQDSSHSSKAGVVAAVGFTTLLGYGSSYYLPAILAVPISIDTDWPLPMVVGGLTVGLLAGAFAAPIVGRAVDRVGGRRVLSIGSMLLGIGLICLGLAQDLKTYLFAWIVVGLGMSAGLYDAAFAALGSWYRETARAPITMVTLIGGLASTVCWPLSAYLVEIHGWRTACFAYAAIHLLVALPVHALLTPTGRHSTSSPAVAVEERGCGALPRWHSPQFLLVAGIFTIAAAITSIISVHLLTILQGRGYALATAVAIGTLLGPSQIFGRAVELIWGMRLHPATSALISALLIAVGILGLGLDPIAAGLAVAVYAAGAGVSFVVKGTLPLAVFGPARYGSLMGRLSLPSLMAQALAPWLATILLARAGADVMLSVLLLLAIAHVVAVACLARFSTLTASP